MQNNHTTEMCSEMYSVQLKWHDRKVLMIRYSMHKCLLLFHVQMLCVPLFEGKENIWAPKIWIFYLYCKYLPIQLQLIAMLINFSAKHTTITSIRWIVQLLCCFFPRSSKQWFGKFNTAIKLKDISFQNILSLVLRRHWTTKLFQQFQLVFFLKFIYFFLE